MSYTIQLIENEISLIEKALNNWETKNYPEAKKERENRLKDLYYSLEVLKENKHQTI